MNTGLVLQSTAEILFISFVSFSELLMSSQMIAQEASKNDTFVIQRLFSHTILPI